MAKSHQCSCANLSVQVELLTSKLSVGEISIHQPMATSIGSSSFAGAHMNPSVPGHLRLPGSVHHRSKKRAAFVIFPPSAICLLFSLSNPLRISQVSDDEPKAARDELPKTDKQPAASEKTGCAVVVIIQFFPCLDRTTSDYRRIVLNCIDSSRSCKCWGR